MVFGDGGDCFVYYVGEVGQYQVVVGIQVCMNMCGYVVGVVCGGYGDVVVDYGVVEVELVVQYVVDLCFGEVGWQCVDGGIDYVGYYYGFYVCFDVLGKWQQVCLFDFG